MGLTSWLETARRAATRATAVAAALSIALASTAPAAQQSEVELYRWLDRHGVVRYTTDLGRIPNSRRSTVIRVIPHAKPTETTRLAPPAPAIPAPGVAPAPVTAPDSDADPFNAPGQVRKVDAQDLARDVALSGRSWPELDARIAELELLVAKDEEAIKELISAPRSGESYDELIHSEALREIGARLPVLQGELAELKRWRDDPGTR